MSKRDLRFCLNLLTDFCVGWQEEALKKQKLQRKKEKSYGHDWDEEHNWCLYWQKLPSELNGSYKSF